MSSEPNVPRGISVVIATKGRVKLLDELLESLDAARSRFPLPSEVILVDDSSPDDVREIEDMCERHDARRIAFGPSVAEKRNVGVRNSRYDVAQFMERLILDGAKPLSSLTDGIHLHTLLCPDEAAFRRTRDALRAAGFLLE